MGNFVAALLALECIQQRSITSVLLAVEGSVIANLTSYIRFAPLSSGGMGGGGG